MRTSILSLFLVACTPAPRDVPPPRHGDRPDLALDQPAAPAWRLLSELEQGRFELPEHNLPDGHPSDGVYPLPDGWSRESSRGRLDSYTRDLPLQLPHKRYRKPPAGLELHIGGEAVDYLRDLDRKRPGKSSWAVIGDTLWLAHASDPETLEPPVELVHPATAQQQARLSFGLAGLPAAEFVTTIATLGAETRACLLLPAPGRASWTVTLPQDAKLRAGLGIHPRIDLSLPESDGVRYELLVDGKQVWSQKIDVEEAFEDVEVDLGSWAGQEVELTLATSPGANSVGDLALWSNPFIASGSSQPRRVVVIGIDTLRPDHTGVHGYGRATSPELDLLAEGAYVFEHAYAPAPRTKPSFRSAFTGSYPLPAIQTPTFGEILGAHGFVTGGYSANVHLVPRFGFSDGFDDWHYDNGAKADEQVDRALTWLERHRDVDSFLFLHIMDPHVFYAAPGRFENMFVEGKPSQKLPTRFNRWEIERLDASGKLDEDEYRYIEGRYDGEVRYTSSELGRLLTTIDGLPGETLLVVHTDHGEEFWEHGGFEHNHSLYDELVRAVLWFRPPGGWAGGPHRIDTQVGLIDIAPTLYDLLGVPRSEWPAMAGSSLAPYLDPSRDQERESLDTSLSDRPLHVGYLMYDKERWAVVWQGGKYILQTISGEEELYDLDQDPSEQKNLVQERASELPAWRERLAQATGWPVGSGLRLELKGRKGLPFELVFPVPVAEAGVLDPEANRSRRANLEWGEEPRATPDQVATVTLSADGTRVRVEPGSRASGTVYVLFGEDVPTTMRFEGDTTARDLSVVAQDQAFEGNHLSLVPGTLIVPKDSMAQRVNQKDEDDATIEALRELGYVE